MLMSSLFRKWSHLASASENMVSSSSCVLSRGGGGSPAFIESTWEGKPKIDWSPKSDNGLTKPKFSCKPSHQVPSQSYLRLPKVCIVREPETQGASELINMLLKDKTTFLFLKFKDFFLLRVQNITWCQRQQASLRASSLLQM